MKRAWKLVSLALIVVLLLSVTALADGAAESDKATITVNVEGVEATFDENNEDIINVTVPDLNPGGQYVVLMVKGTEESYPITSDSILYIDQAAASENGTVAFHVYPSGIQDSVILIAGVGVSEDGGPLVVASVKAKYVLGDVNSDSFIDATDALQVLRYKAKLLTLDSNALAAADVNKDNYVDATDALQILRYRAGLISEFGNEGE